jgi:hypothetical protein
MSTCYDIPTESGIDPDQSSDVTPSVDNRTVYGTDPEQDSIKTTTWPTNTSKPQHEATEKEEDIVETAVLNPLMSQEDIASRVDASQPYVSQTLSAYYPAHASVGTHEEE